MSIHYQFLKVGDQYRERRILGNLGLVFKQFGQPDKAIDRMSETQISKDIGNKRRMGMHLVNLGNVFQDRGRFERAANSTSMELRLPQKSRISGEVHLGNLAVCIKIRVILRRLWLHINPLCM